MQEQQRGVSPVVAVILLVAVTVTLSAVIGGFALNLGQSATSGSSQDVGVSVSQSDGNVTATVVTGEPDEIKLLVNGSEEANLSNPSVGSTLSVSAQPGADVTVVTVTNGERSVTSSTTVTTSNTVSGITAPESVSDSQVAYWPIEDETTDRWAEIENGHDAVHTGSTDYGTRGDDTTSVFDEKGDVANVSHVWKPPLTITFWINPASLCQNTPIVHNGYSWSNDKGWQLKSGGDNCGDGDADFEVLFGDDWTFGGVGPTSAGKWSHVAITLNGSNAGELYVNATLITTGSTTNSINGYSSQTNFSRGGYNGSIDDVRIFNRTLNQSEIQDIYDATK